MEGYKAGVREASKELSKREILRIKNFTSAVALDEAVTEDVPLTIEYAFHALIDIHNDRSDNKDYTKCVVVDEAGGMYVTGSESFYTSLQEICEVMGDEKFTISVLKKPSKNYKGKSFLTCEIV